MSRLIWGGSAAAVAAMVVVSFACVPAADAARRRSHQSSTASNGPETPEIKTSTSNSVPACVTPEKLMAFLRGNNDHLDAKFQAIAADYKKRTKIEATIFVSRPAAGATVIKA